MNLLLLANFEDIMRVIVPLLFLLFWVLGQLGDLKKKPKQVVGRPEPDNGPPVDQADPLRKLMEEVLEEDEKQRRPDARDLRPHRPQPQRDESFAEIELMTDDDPHASEAIPIEPVPVQPARQPPRQKPRTRRPAVPPRQPAASAKSISEHSSHLGKNVALADDKLEARLHAKFDQKLGTLSESRDSDAYERTVASNVAANQIASMLSDPQQIRHAIILQEILKRPEERW